MAVYVINVSEGRSSRTYTMVASSLAEAYIKATRFSDPAANVKVLSVLESDQKPTKDTL